MKLKCNGVEIVFDITFLPWVCCYKIQQVSAWRRQGLVSLITLGRGAPNAHPCPCTGCCWRTTPHLTHLFKIFGIGPATLRSSHVMKIDNVNTILGLGYMHKARTGTKHAVHSDIPTHTQAYGPKRFFTRPGGARQTGAAGDDDFVAECFKSPSPSLSFCGRDSLTPLTSPIIGRLPSTTHC